MSITKEFDTITAISTPLGEGAVSYTHLITVANNRSESMRRYCVLRY